MKEMEILNAHPSTHAKSRRGVDAIERPSVKWTDLAETRVPATKAGRGTVYTVTPGQSVGTICSVTRTPRVGATPPTIRRFVGVMTVFMAMEHSAFQMICVNLTTGDVMSRRIAHHWPLV